MNILSIYLSDEHDTKAIRAELARIALSLGYKQRKQYTEIEAGSIGLLLAAIASGEVVLVKKEGDE
jgi:hypothetical protein